MKNSILVALGLAAAALGGCTRTGTPIDLAMSRHEPVVAREDPSDRPGAPPEGSTAADASGDPERNDHDNERLPKPDEIFTFHRRAGDGTSAWRDPFILPASERATTHFDPIPPAKPASRSIAIIKGEGARGRPAGEGGERPVVD